MSDTKKPYNLTESDAFRPTVPVLTNVQGTRSAERYLGIIAQFDVVNNLRYQPNRQGKNETYCNIFVWDVTAAMGCEIPHWVDDEGNPVGVGKGRELNANAIYDWLMGRGAQCGWRQVQAVEASKRANAGYPTVACWKNPVGIGHVAMVIPSDLWFVAIAQAGRKNYHNVDVSRGFSNRIIKYFTHE